MEYRLFFGSDVGRHRNHGKHEKLRIILLFFPFWIFVISMVVLGSFLLFTSTWVLAFVFIYKLFSLFCFLLFNFGSSDCFFVLCIAAAGPQVPYSFIGYLASVYLIGNRCILSVNIWIVVQKYISDEKIQSYSSFCLLCTISDI
jgi:hypothetical protein